MKWRFGEITWKEVRKAISNQYRKEEQYVQSSSYAGKEGFTAKFHHFNEVYWYNILIQDDIQTIGNATLENRNENCNIKIDDETLEAVEKYGLDKVELEKLSKTAFSDESFISRRKIHLG